MAKGKRWDMKKKLAEMKSAERTLPKRVGNVALNFYLKSWENEAFSYDSNGSDPWAKRKSATKRDKSTGKRRGLLVQSGSLIGSMRVKSATWNKIALGSYGLKYASYHNNGTGSLPQRQFIGKSLVLDRKIKRIINTAIKKVL
jgi:hypothetical protein